MSRVYQQRLQQHRQLAAKLGELDIFLTGLRHMVNDAPFATDAERLEAIRGMFTGTVRVRAVPTLQPGELKLEFYRLEVPEPVRRVVVPDDHPLAPDYSSVTEGVTPEAETT